MTTIEAAQSICNSWSSLTDNVNWEAIKSFANSPFMISLIGAFAGAFAGAVGAQHIAERSKHREEMLSEMRNTNAAIALTFGVCNSLLALKKQHVKSLKERYEAQQAKLQEFRRKRNEGEVQLDVALQCQFDMQTLQFQALPMDTLRAVVFERLSIVGRPLNLVVALTQSVQCLEDSLTKRNTLIEGYKTEFAKDNQGLATLYFGLPYGEGHVNLDYPGTINAIYNQTDDGIFFGNLLCKDLHEHGKQLSGVFKKKFKNDPPSISEVDFASATSLMPDETNYADWVKAFVKKL